MGAEMTVLPTRCAWWDEQSRVVCADAARGRVVVAGQVVRRRRRLRAPVAGRAGGCTVGAHLERVALLARGARFSAGEVGAVATLAPGEVPVVAAHQVAVELRIVRIHDSALVGDRAEE